MHGVNVVYKEAPYLPIIGEDFSDFDPNNSLIKFDIENLRKWGMNHVRLGVTWESVERSPGIYHYDYLN
jgi:aryl-phospho-beta-D-glucosidase BglC (GH1 family)